MVTVAVDPGRREDLSQTIKELKGGEAERGAAGAVGVGEEVEDLVGPASDQVEAVVGEGGPGAVAGQALEARAVGGPDADAAVALTASPIKDTRRNDFVCNACQVDIGKASAGDHQSRASSV